MIHSTAMLPYSRSLARTSLASGLILLLLGSPSRVAAQSDDFNDGNDTTPKWTHYSLPDVPPIYFGAATYSFPADNSGGQACRIYAPPIVNDLPSEYGGPLRNARAGSFRADVPYSGRLSVGTDLLAWNDSWHQEAGMIFYFQDINLGTSDGYTATYSSDFKNLYLSRILNEVPTTVAELGRNSVLLDPTHRYRLVVSTHDSYTLLFQLFDKADLSNPLKSAIGQDATYTAGVCGLFVFEQNYPSTTEGADATFDNYLAMVPAAGTLPATVTDLYPPPGGNATEVYPTVTVGILDRDSMVNSSTIVLYQDGVWIPNASLGIEYQVHRPKNPAAFPRDFAGATVTFTNTALLPWGSKHTNIIAFADYNNAWQTNTWTWTTAYPYLFSSNSLPVGSLRARGFDARMAQTDNGGQNLENSLARALQQLAIPPAIPVDRAATSIVQVLSWDKTGTPAAVPGLCGGSYRNIAVESCAYLELTAGVHRFRINTDDRAGVYSGVNLADPGAAALWVNAEDTANATFDFFVEASGLYPVRCLWEETGGDAHLYLRSVDLNDATEVDINDPSDPPGVVKAWYPVLCRSAASVTGPFNVEHATAHTTTRANLVSADCAPTVVGEMVTGGTFTVPVPAATRFYRLDGPRTTKITNIKKVDSSIEITYEMH